MSQLAQCDVPAGIPPNAFKVPGSASVRSGDSVTLGVVRLGSQAAKFGLRPGDEIDHGAMTALSQRICRTIRTLPCDLRMHAAGPHGPVISAEPSAW